MNLEQLYTIVSLADVNSFNEAAKALNTTQPGISNRIRSLEDELEIKLFDRNTRSVRITSEGRKCAELATQIIQLVDQIKNISPIDQPLSGIVTLGISESIALSWLSNLILQLQDDYPQVEIDIDIGPTPYLFKKLMKGDVDIMMAGGLPIQTIGKNLVIDSLGKLELAWVISENSKLFPDIDKPYTPCQLMDARIFLYSRRALMHELVFDWFYENGAQLGRVNMCDSIPSTQAMIKMGLGISLLPLQLIQESINKNDLRVITTNPPAPSIEFYSIYKNKRNNTINKSIVDISISTSDFIK